MVKNLIVSRRSSSITKKERTTFKTMISMYNQWLHDNRDHFAREVLVHPVDAQEILHGLGVPQLHTEESIPSLTFCGVTQGDIDDPKNRIGHFLLHQFVAFPSDLALPHDKWDTHCPETFCSNCKKVKINPITTRWECLGHPTQ
jgi:hypothetical protein